MLDLIGTYRRIALIGMAKNAGKTTVLNHIIKTIASEYQLAITSIGFDGEELDHIYQTKKPKIEVIPGMLFATTKDALKDSTIDYDVIKELPITTAMGAVVIGVAKSIGTVQLTGPSRKLELEQLNQEFVALGAEKILLDGAFGKLMQADHTLVDACILATGASYSTDVKKLVHDTLYIANLFDCAKLHQFDGTLNVLRIESALTNEFHNQFILDQDTSMIELKGACTDSFVTLVMKQKHNHQPLTILLENPTYYFVDERIAKLASAKQIRFAFSYIPKLLAITINPLHPSGVLLDKDELKHAFMHVTSIPIINVCE